MKHLINTVGDVFNFLFASIIVTKKDSKTLKLPHVDVSRMFANVLTCCRLTAPSWNINT